MLYRFYNK